MITKRSVFSLIFAATLAALIAPASAQDTIKIGELNSYKTQAAFLDPYKKGMEMALDEINGKGGLLGKKVELVSRDDGTNPGEAVRVAEELITREGVPLIAGTFLSHIGLAVTNFAGETLVPKSMTRNPAPFHIKATRFLPMSCRSPRTVPIRSVPTRLPPASFAAVRSGFSTAIPAFMARAAISTSGT